MSQSSRRGLHERALRDVQTAALNRREVFSLGAAAAAALLIVLLLTPGGGGARERVPAVALESTAAVFPSRWPILASTRTMQKAGRRPGPKRAPSRVKSPSVEPDVQTVPSEAAALASTEAPAAAPQVPRIDLPRVASICADLARVVDTRTLPSLLERAAEALDAERDRALGRGPRRPPTLADDGPWLRAAMVVRLGTIERDAENATAAAFRTCLIQTVDADAISNGAIAAPLVGAGGCVGVMAAEVRHRGEHDDTLLAAAAIIAGAARHARRTAVRPRKGGGRRLQAKIAKAAKIQRSKVAKDRKDPKIQRSKIQRSEKILRQEICGEISAL